jgi:hypothetical protein
MAIRAAILESKHENRERLHVPSALFDSNRLTHCDRGTKKICPKYVDSVSLPLDQAY